MLSAPLSEVSCEICPLVRRMLTAEKVYGRKVVYFVNLPIFLLLITGATLAQNIETLVICRMFAGIFGGPALAVSGGSFVDVWELKSSGLAVSVQAIATFMGPSVGKYS